MTEKQEKILKSALELFAKEGYHATSTSKVANNAGVSEGLIFRHFKNKEGLLMAILKEGENKLNELFADIVMESDPQEVVRKAIELPFIVPESEYEFWGLQYKLKWEIEMDYSHKTEPLTMALALAFVKLNYESPQQEAEFLTLSLDAIGAALIKRSMANADKMKSFLLKKYGL
ncbi:MAG: helix-turn-helix transcriptional regulator [Bacteroidales bacterium]|nr:helix-turn-helix transcriptional regulator [Bacteroidales bacterium]